MSEKTEQSQTQTLDKKDQQETQNLSEQEKPKELEIEELIPGLPKFEKIYENKDMNIFKEDILNYLRDRDKCIYGLIKGYKEQMEKTEKNYSDLTKRISNNYSDILSSQAELNNRLDKLNSYESFTTKTNDQLISHEIRINNIREDFQKSCQKYDKIYLENLELPGYIGKYAKYKNCQTFFEEVIKELNKLNSYKEKNTLDLKAYKEKLELNIKTFNSLVDNNNKSQIKYINEMYEKNFKECKSLIDTLEERITDMRIENSRYAVELIGKSINLTKEWDKIQTIKEEIMHEFNDKIHEFRLISSNTINSFNDYKNEFNSIKRKFFELAEFIKDVRFRKNIGGDVKKKEIKCIAKKITGKKACGKSIDKEKEKILLEYNFKGEKNDLRKSVSQEPGGKIKNYIKGVTNVEELKQDSRVHNNLSSERIKKKLKTEQKSTSNNNINRKKQKNNTVVAGVNNLRNLKKENIDIHSEESDNSENNSLSNVVQVNNKDNNKENYSVEGIGSTKTNYGTNSNSNNRYLFKDVPIETDDKIINELASDLEQTNNKVNDNKEQNNNNNIQTLINKIEPMNINMNINKIENLNYNNNNENIIKEKKIQTKKNLNNDITSIQKENTPMDSVITNFDKKLTNIEIYTKEKIIDLIAQIENLRQLFVNTNKIQSFAVNPLFKFPTYNTQITNTASQPQKMKEAHIVEIGGKMLPPPSKVSKKYLSNANNVITAKDKEKDFSNKDNSNRELNMIINKAEINLPKDISQRIKTGKPPTSIKTIINRTLGGNNNNTIIFSNMANDFNSKFLKGVEKKPINGNIINKNNFGENNNLNLNGNINMNKYIDLHKITTNLAVKTQNNYKGDINLLANDINNNKN